MSYYINKKSETRWVVIYESRVNKERTQRAIPKDEYPSLGFYENMTLEEAKGRAKQLNAEGRNERARNRTLARLSFKRKTIESAHLPTYLTDSFEEDVLKRRYNNSKKMLIHWRFAQRMLAEMNTDVFTLFDQPELVYNYFIDRKLSLDYLSKITRVTNLWGMHCGRKQGRAYESIPAPRNVFRERVADAYFQKTGQGKESLPITPQMLQNHGSQFPVLNLNWLLISVWFGLRPHEVDALRIDSTCKVEHINHITKGPLVVLAVYQSKLIGISRDKRWKRIPLLHPEQHAALEHIKTGAFKRPLVKTVQRYLGKGYTPYGGRKGFVDLMTDRGHSIEVVSQWLGHTKVDRTWANYRNKRKVAI